MDRTWTGLVRWVLGLTWITIMAQIAFSFVYKIIDRTFSDRVTHTLILIFMLRLQICSNGALDKALLCATSLCACTWKNNYSPRACLQ